jgi:hypothetical protein
VVIAFLVTVTVFSFRNDAANNFIVSALAIAFICESNLYRNGPMFCASHRHSLKPLIGYESHDVSNPP